MPCRAWYSWIEYVRPVGFIALVPRVNPAPLMSPLRNAGNSPTETPARVVGSGAAASDGSTPLSVTPECAATSALSFAAVATACERKSGPAAA